MPSLAQVAGSSAWLAAAMTVVGMVTLLLFFARGGTAVVGVWYLLTALVSGGTAIPDGVRVACGAAGVGLILVGYGFVRGGERHPASAIGGLVAFVSSLAFQLYLGAALLNKDLVVPDWNA